MGFELATLVMIGTDYIGSCKSNYHAIRIKTTTAPLDAKTTIIVLDLSDVNDTRHLAINIFFTNKNKNLY